MILIFFAWVLYMGSITMKSHYMSDFQSYYYGTTAAVEGLNPYRASSVAHIKGENVPTYIHFAYAPYMLPIFWPLTKLPYESARLVFLAAKLLAAMALFCVWMKGFDLKRRTDPFVLAVLAIGAFHCTIRLDIIAGNISIFEQLFLWSGIAFFLRGKLKLAMIGILLAGLCKGPLIVFLGIFLFKPDAKNLHAMSEGVASFLVINLATFFCFPEISLNFLQNPNVLDSTGYTNPSLLVWIIYDFVPFFKAVAGGSLNPQNVYKTLLFIFAAIFGFSYLFVMRKEEDRYKVAFFALAYGIMVPRMKDYSFVLQIMPALFVLDRLKNVGRYVVLVLLSITLWPYYHLFTQIMLISILIFVSSGVTFKPKATSSKQDKRLLAS